MCVHGCTGACAWRLETSVLERWRWAGAVGSGVNEGRGRGGAVIFGGWFGGVARAV